MRELYECFPSLLVTKVMKIWQPLCFLSMWYVGEEGPLPVVFHILSPAAQPKILRDNLGLRLNVATCGNRRFFFDMSARLVNGAAARIDVAVQSVFRSAWDFDCCSIHLSRLISITRWETCLLMDHLIYKLVSLSILKLILFVCNILHAYFHDLLLLLYLNFFP